MKTKITDFAASAKAWVGAAIAGLTGLASFVVPDSAPGKLIAAGLGFLVALYAVFAKENAAPKPEAPSGQTYLG
jgi:hypothetical protein